nr:gamma-2-syntrophin-like [Lytechinus pictus]
MDGGGGGSGGVTPKILHLQRALSGGFGFSLMGGRGTGFPPVICDILSDSPASECEGMQVGDIILEINNETMDNKSTKEGTYIIPL